MKAVSHNDKTIPEKYKKNVIFLYYLNIATLQGIAQTTNENEKLF